MTSLTQDQKDFLDKYHLDNSIIFDASGMSRKEYKPIMKKLEKDIAIGVSPCEKSGHTMRTSFGSCLQCNPQSIAYFKRRNETAYIYVVVSESKRLFKVGSATDVSKREKKLNNNLYGGINDRKLVYYGKYPRAGEIEKEIHKNLDKYLYENEYICFGKKMISYEIFKCDYLNIKMIIDKIKLQLGKNNILDEKEIDNF